jgi:hypothetical protein
MRTNRRLVPVALAAASVALLGASSSAALASSTPVAAAHRQNVGPASHKAAKIRYVAQYTDEKFGPVRCKGVHITSTEYPGTATSGGADRFKCKSTTGKPLLFGAPGETLVNFTEWQSDYFAFAKSVSVLAKSLKATISGNGKSYTGLAVYPSPEEEAQKAKEAEEKAEKEKIEQEEKEKEESE